MKRMNLHKLACELAKRDDPKARNIDVVATETTLAALGAKLRDLPMGDALGLLAAIVARSGRTVVVLAIVACLTGCMSDKQWSDTAKMHAVYMGQQRTFQSFEAVGSNMTFSVTGANRISMSAPLNPLTTIPAYPEFTRDVVDGVKTVAGYAAMGYIGSKVVDGWAGSQATAPAVAP